MSILTQFCIKHFDVVAPDREPIARRLYTWLHPLMSLSLVTSVSPPYPRSIAVYDRVLLPGVKYSIIVILFKAMNMNWCGIRCGMRLQSGLLRSAEEMTGSYSSLVDNQKRNKQGNHVLVSDYLLFRR